MIAFTRTQPVLAETFNRHSVQVLFARSDTADKTFTLLFSWEQISGTASGIQLDVECGNRLQVAKPGGDVAAGAVTGLRFRPAFRQGPAVPATWPPGHYRVILEGNFILGAAEIEVPDPVDPSKRIKVRPGLDGEHFGPGVQKGRCPTGDAIEGGRFFSWFEIGAPG
jgi:hypothetical protein